MAVPQADLDAIKAEIKAVDEKECVAIRNHDYGMVSETFAEDCIFISPGSPVVKGRASMKIVIEQYGQAGVTHFKFDKEEFQLLGKYVFRFGEATLLDKDDKAVDVCNIAQIWRKDADGQYRRLFEMVNNRNPPIPPSS